MAATIPIEMIDPRRGTPCHFIEMPKWKAFDTKVFECRVLLCPEETGGYSAHALRLPGVVSQGETVEEALTNIKEAFRAAAQVYLSDLGAIPWSESEVEERPKGSKEKWISVDV